MHDVAKLCGPMRLLLVLTFLAAGQVAFPQCEFPLHLGDWWQYTDPFPLHGYRPHDAAISSFVERGGHVYASFTAFATDPGPGCIRKSGDTVYAYADSLEYVLYRFSASPGDTIGVRAGFTTTLLNRDSVSLFGGVRKRWVFYEVGSMPWNAIRREVVDSIGLTYIYDELSGVYYNLRGAVIGGVEYGMVTDVKSATTGQEGGFDLAQNYPNPFNPSTTITFELPRASQVNLSVFDILGRGVSVSVNEWRDAGVHEVKFDGSNLPSGVYFYRLQAGDFTQTKRLLLLK